MMVTSISNLIDDSNLLIFDPKTAKIIFSVGQGVFNKATKLMSSLTQALILFAEKVVNQDISYIRFQNLRMVFLHTEGLFAIKMVPKDQLPKDYLLAMRIVVGLISGAQNSKTKLQDVNKEISALYTILKSPENATYVFSKTVEGYKTCLVFLAGLNFDLSMNLEKIGGNIVFFNPERPKEIKMENKSGLLSFTNAVELKNVSTKEKLNLMRDFQFINSLVEEPNPIKIVQYLFGSESNATKTGDIILSEENLDEIIGMIVKVDSASGIDFAIQAINNYNKDQKVGKTLYQLVVAKLNSIEKQTDSITTQEEVLSLPEQKQLSIDLKPESEPEQEPKTIIAGFEEDTEKIKTSDLPVDETVSTTSPSSLAKASSETSGDSLPERKSLSSSLGNFSSLASEFTNKMKDLYETDDDKQTTQININADDKQEIPELDLLDINYDNELANLPHNKFQIMMKAVKIYLDLKPFVSGNLEFDKINYRPSLQAYTNEDYSISIEIKIHPIRHDEFYKSLTIYVDTDDYEISQESKGVFIIGTTRDNFPNLFRVCLWLLLIDYSYNVQKKVVPPTEFFNIKNGSICIIPDGITPERKKHLPSNISEIIEEEKLLKDANDPVSIVQGLDELLQKIHSKLKSGKGKAIGFVPRPENKEIPLIFEFVLTLSELTGIGWSRW